MPILLCKRTNHSDPNHTISRISTEVERKLVREIAMFDLKQIQEKLLLVQNVKSSRNRGFEKSDVLCILNCRPYSPQTANLKLQKVTTMLSHALIVRDPKMRFFPGGSFQLSSTRFGFLLAEHSKLC